MKTVTITKSAAGETATPVQLENINLFTRRELTADEVYVFSIILCDNEIDRDFEQFPEASLETLGELFLGKTGVFDHEPKAENQSARIFETKLVREERLNTLGEQYCCLKAWAYMVRCDKNADLILEIDAGIKKEVSVGCSVEQISCSICGADQKIVPCSHKKGEHYDGGICYYLLVNPIDAYEWSFVAVPAQKSAGVTKKHRQGGDLLELSKLFDSNGDIALAKTDADALKTRFLYLESMAETGKMYLETLRRDVIRLASLAQPELPSAVMESVVGKLDATELIELQKTFGKAVAKSYPISPQLVPESARPAAETDNQFKI